MMQNRIVLPASPSAWLLGAALVFAPLSSVRVTELLSVCDVLFVFSVAVGAVEKVVYRESVPVIPIYIVAALLFLASYFAGIGESRPDATKFFYIVVINAVIVPCAILFVRIRTPDEMRCLLYVWTFGAFYGATFTVLYCKGYIPSHYDLYWHRIGRAAGLTTHPNTQALNAILAIPGLLLLFCSLRSIWLRALILLMLLVLWQAVDYSGSRASAASFFLVIAVFSSLFFHQATSEQRAWMFLGLLGLLLLVAAFLAFGSINPRPRSALWRLFYAPVLSSNTERAALNSAAWRGFVEAPFFGQGYQWTRVAHNIYLQALHTSGLTGLTGYLISFLAPAYYLLQTQMIRRDRLLVITLASSVITLLVAAWYKSSYTDLNIAITFSLALFVGAMMRTRVSLLSKTRAKYQG